MKNFSKVAIKLFVIYSIYLFLSSTQFIICSIIQSAQSFPGGDKISDFWIIFEFYLPYFIIWIVYGVILLIFWINADSIAKSVVRGIEPDKNKSELQYEDYLSLGLVILGVFIFVDTIPKFFQNFTLFFMSKTTNQLIAVDTEYLYIKHITALLTLILKLLLAAGLIVKNKKITAFVKKQT